jgi:hypothetical protein
MTTTSTPGSGGTLRSLLCLGMAVVMASSSVTAVPAYAQERAPEVGWLLDGLTVAAVQIDRTGDLPALREPLPLLPAGTATLVGLDAGVVSALVREAAVTDPLDLDALEGALADAELEEDRFSATFEDVRIVDHRVDGVGAVDLALDLEMAREVDVRLFYDEERYEDRSRDDAGEALDEFEDATGLPPRTLIETGEVTVTTSLSGTIALTLEVDEDEQPHLEARRWLPGSPEDRTGVFDFALAVEGADDVSGRFGFTAIDGAADLVGADLRGTLTLQDLSGRGQIPAMDLATALPIDLWGLELRGAVNVNLNASSDLVDTGEEWQLTLGAHDSVSVELPDNDGQPVFPPVGITIHPDLAPFDRVSAEDVLVALGEAAVALHSAGRAGAVDLPLLGGDTLDVVDPGGDLADFVRARSETLITCGSVPSSPPEGLPRPGDTAYCQAFASVEEPTDVAWTDWDGPLTSTEGGALDETVGVSPNATVAVPADTIQQLQVTWTEAVEEGQQDEATVERVGRWRPQTAQQLNDALARAGWGWGAAIGRLAPLGGEPETALTFGLERTHEDGVALPWDLEDAFRPATKVAGLRVTNDEPVDVTGHATVSSGFGITLGADAALPPTNVTESAALRERFLLWADEGGTVLSFDAPSAQARTVGLTGRIGSLPLTATVDLTLGDGVDDTGADAGIAVRVPGADDDWVPLPDVLAVLDVHAADPTPQAPARPFEAQVDLAASGLLTVQPAIQDATGGLLAGARAELAWTATSPGTTPIDITDMSPALQRLLGADLRPEIRGTAGEGGDARTLKDPSADFDVALRGAPRFDLDPSDATDETVNVMLFNTTDNSFCRGVQVHNATTLGCDEPLIGNVEQLDAENDEPELRSTWEAGDEYLIEADVDALRDLLLAGLTRVVQALPSATEGPLTQALPFGTARPVDVLGELTLVADTLAEQAEPLRGGGEIDELALTAAAMNGGSSGIDAPTLDSLVQVLNDAIGALDLGILENVTVGTRLVSLGDGVVGAQLYLQADLDTSVASALRVDLGDDLLMDVAGSGSVNVDAEGALTLAVVVPLDRTSQPPDVYLDAEDTDVALTFSASEPPATGTPLQFGGSQLVVLDAVTGTMSMVPDSISDPENTLADDTASFDVLGLAPGDTIVLHNVTTGLSSPCSVWVIQPDAIVCREALLLPEEPDPDPANATGDGTDGEELADDDESDPASADRDSDRRRDDRTNPSCCSRWVTSTAS